MASELEPCYFCGETDQDALAYKNTGCPCIYCMTCGAEGPSGDNEADAKIKWNTRVDPQRDRLVETLEWIRDHGGECAANKARAVLEEAKRHES